MTDFTIFNCHTYKQTLKNIYRVIFVFAEHAPIKNSENRNSRRISRNKKIESRWITRIHVNAPFVELVKTNKNARSVSVNINEILRR